MNEILLENKKYLSKLLVYLLFALCLFVTFKVVTEIRSYTLGGKIELNTISVSGKGEVQAVPDIATLYVTLRQESPTLKNAQDTVKENEAKLLSFLKEKGVLEKDIKASGISFYPKYQYRYDTPSLKCAEFGCPPQTGKNVIYAYEVSENINIKVRNVDTVGEVVDGIGALGITELNGPDFTIDEEDGLKTEARKKAIEDAKDKAKVLAKDLGVRLVRIKSFSEGGDLGYYPTYARAEKSMDMAMEASSFELPKGENTISSNVNIVYEVR